MARRFPEPWREMATIAVIGGGTLLLLLLTRASAWLHVGIVALGVVGSALPVLALLALVPWHFLALHRGLVRRSTSPYVVSVTDGFLLVERGERRIRHALGEVARARLAYNGNWTESKMLEDALGLFAANGREIVRLPLSTGAVDAVLRALEARGIPVEHVEVSAPAVLD